jgi:hypothetical protein
VNLIRNVELVNFGKMLAHPYDAHARIQSSPGPQHVQKRPTLAHVSQRRLRMSGADFTALPQCAKASAQNPAYRPTRNHLHDADITSAEELPSGARCGRQPWLPLRGTRTGQRIPMALPFVWRGRALVAGPSTTAETSIGPAAASTASRRTSDEPFIG